MPGCLAARKGTGSPVASGAAEAAPLRDASATSPAVQPAAPVNRAGPLRAAACSNRRRPVPVKAGVLGPDVQGHDEDEDIDDDPLW